MSKNTRHSVLGRFHKLLLPSLVLVLVFISTVFGWWIRHPAGHLPEVAGASVSAAAPKTVPGASRPEGAVACLGHIEPQNGVLRVSAAYLDGRPQRVRVLKVKQGDQVDAGQLLAILDGNHQLQTAARVADARVALAGAKLSQVKAGATQPEIAAQKADVEGLQAALENTRSEYRRYDALQRNTDVSVAQLESRRLAVTTAERSLEQAQERLKDISRVRPGDVEIAEAELSVAVAESEAAHARMNSGVVRSPAAGQVLRILAHEGEEAGTGGLLDLGKTDSMYVEAEVYETDIARVRPGQHTAITSDLFTGTMSGVVEIVGTTLAKNDVLPLDPVSFADARVFKVWIRLNDGAKVAGLVHGKVNVVIQP
jgi:HlyD family secretion protein